MSDWLFWLRVLNLCVWAVLAIYMAPAAWTAARGKHVRRGDPMRLAVFVTALVMVGFFARWLIAPDNLSIWIALHIMAIADALYIASLARSYGRGSHVRG